LLKQAETRLRGETGLAIVDVKLLLFTVLAGYVVPRVTRFSSRSA